MIVPCECGANLKVDDSKIGERGAKVRCPRCGNIMRVQKPAPQPAVAPPEPSPAPRVSAPSPPQTAPLVLVAHESEAVRTMVGDILSEGGFGVESAAEGVEALKKATELRPQVMLLDVGLPGIYGFELCERLKGDEQTSSIKIILLASAYDMTRYRREPATLYGADDYVEKHQINDYLVSKIRKLLYPEEYAPAPEQAAPSAPDVGPSQKTQEKAAEAFEFSPESLLRMESEAPAPLSAGLKQSPEAPALAPESFTVDSSIFQKPESEMPRVDEGDPEAVEKAKRLARIIVSDVALYNPEAVSEGIKNGTFYELLKDDVEEGRRLYEKRVPEAIRAKKDFYREAFDNFIAAQKKIVR